jgi:outer membrane protein assembly factor BamB
VLAAALTLAAGAPAGAPDWAMFHQNARHTGASTETAIRSSNASQLGVRWEANTGARSYTSPVVAYNAKLGRSVVYVGNSAGDMSAYDVRTGDRIWTYATGAQIQSSAAIVAGTLYVGSGDHYLYALNAATGALACRFLAGGNIASSPVVTNPDGSGRVVYFGDNGFSGQDDGGHEWAVNAVDPNAAANCSPRWSFDGWGDPVGSQPKVGSWSPPAFAKDVNGRPLVIMGSSSPEGAVYALDASTGAKVWRFQTRVDYDSDVGAGPTISLPGVNGFADGVVYVAGKDRVLYALNLRTGAEIWQFDGAADSAEVMRSTAALVGKRLYLGYGAGVYAVDAVTGAVSGTSGVWKHVTGVETVSSPAVTGPAGDRVVMVGDMFGTIRALDALTGAERWSFETGDLVFSSPAVSGGKIFVTSSTGFLYAFDLGGGVSAPPATTISQPTSGMQPNTGSLQITGQATDDVGVSKVLVALKNINTTKWWNAATGTWGRTFQQSSAALSGTPANRSWTTTVPVPAGGGPFYVQAEAVDTDGQHDPTVPGITFEIQSLTHPPDTSIDTPLDDAVLHFPLDGNGDPIYEPFEIVASGEAVDDGGPHPGVDHVLVTIANQEHDEYYCGAPGCGVSGESSSWSPTLTVLTVPVADPGSTSTTWTTSFLTYDHPHTYRITAWAVDLDNKADPARASVHICVRPPGEEICY